MNPQDLNPKDTQASWSAQKQAPDSLLANVLARLEQRQPYLREDLAPAEQQAGLHHPTWEIRAAAVRTLDGKDDALTLELLQPALQDEHRLVRVAALRVLSHMKKNAPLEYLLRALSDSDWEVREMAVLALGEIHAQKPDLIPPLLRVARHDPDGIVRDAAQHALAWNENEQAAATASNTIRETTTAEKQPSTLYACYLNIRNACCYYGWLFQKQGTILPKSIWIWSLLIILLGTLLSIMALQKVNINIQNATLYLTLFACISASSGIAFLYGGDNDAGLELTLATPTSIRIVMLFRFLLVVGYNLLLSLLASGVLALLHGGDIWGIIQLWFAPVILFAMTAFSISLLIGSWLSVFITLLINASRALVFHINQGTTSIYLASPASWQINPMLFIAAAGLVIVAIIYAPRQPRLVEI